MGNTLLHFYRDKSDDDKNEQGLTYLTEYLNKFNNSITIDEVNNGFFKIWM